jgi:murein DD-endopeptidase MepM/ murein hydrolase activator NlpD
VVSPPATTSYTLACSGAGGIAGNTVTVAVRSGAGQKAQVTGPATGMPQVSHFTWPTDPQNASNGYYAACGDWHGLADACYWISANGWRDANPFQRHYNTAPVPGYHLGADWTFGSGAAELPVFAVAGGIVSSVQPNVSGWGNIVFIRHNTPWGIYTSMYAHVYWASFGMPVVNQIVSKGQQIAVMGNANGSYAYPLHLEIRAADNTDPGPGYTRDRSTPQAQIDPNLFISTHR